MMTGSGASLPLSLLDTLFVALNQTTTPQVMVGTFTFPSVKVSSLTAGRIPFASTGGLLDDDSNLLWDDTNKRLGVRITPQYPFHIQQNNGDAWGIGIEAESGLGASMKLGNDDYSTNYTSVYLIGNNGANYGWSLSVAGSYDYYNQNFDITDEVGGCVPLAISGYGSGGNNFGSVRIGADPSDPANFDPQPYSLYNHGNSVFSGEIFLGTAVTWDGQPDGFLKVSSSSFTVDTTARCRWRGFGTATPSSPQEGDIWDDTNIGHIIKIYSNGAWRTT